MEKEIKDTEVPMTEEERFEREKNLQIIRGYRPIDDDFMRELFRDDIPLTEYVLRIITGINDLKIIKSETQFDLHSLSGARSLRLDVLGTDSKGKKINLEVQRADAGAAAKRVRYHSSALDIEFLKSGEDFSKLPETYVIFITENDVMGGSEPIYHVDRIVKETGKLFDDEAHIIYVNGAYRDESPLGLLMHDFACTNPADMHYKILADKTRYFKEDEKGVAAMCKVVEDLCNDAKIEEKKEIAIRLLRQSELSNEKIAEYVGLNVEVVNALDEEQKVATY